MEKFKALTASIIMGIVLLGGGYFIQADDLGTSARFLRTVYTVPAGGSLTITNSSPSGGGQLWSSVSACHTNTLTNNTFSIELVADDGFEQAMWTSDPHTNDSVIVEFISGRLVKDGDVITFANTVTGEETKVYVTHQNQ